MQIGSISCNHRAASAYADEGAKAGRAHGERHRRGNEDHHSGRAERRHGGGASRIGDAVAQALKSLGFTGRAAVAAPASNTQSEPTNSAADQASTASANDGTRASMHQIRHDLHDFMHALFDAIKGNPETPAKSVTTSAQAANVTPKATTAKTTTTSTTAITSAASAATTSAAAMPAAAGPAAPAATATTPATTANAAGQAAVRAYGGNALGSGLAALIARVSGGSAPDGLQSAFNRLLSHVQAPPAATADSATGPTTPVTLQAFLTKLQDLLGIVMPDDSTTSGALVNTTA